MYSTLPEAGARLRLDARDPLMARLGQKTTQIISVCICIYTYTHVCVCVYIYIYI